MSLFPDLSSLFNLTDHLELLLNKVDDLQIVELLQQTMINTEKLTNSTLAQYEKLDLITSYFWANQTWMLVLFGILFGVALFSMIVGVVALVIIAIKLTTAAPVFVQPAQQPLALQVNPGRHSKLQGNIDP
uniref:Uncharacterized protein n=1 Tax=Panagrolaimus sp. JU765 TaxID=591449 RepID=A0AC34RJV0_9BILA